jgi:pimeloyl-ACP methyl ester carboxylesterase
VRLINTWYREGRVVVDESARKLVTAVQSARTQSARSRTGSAFADALSMRRQWPVLGFTAAVVGLAIWGADSGAPEGRDPIARSGSESSAGFSELVGLAEPAKPKEPIRVEEIRVGSDRSYVLRGARGTQRMVFLHGLCGHPQGYIQSFQYAAAEHGTVIGPTGDLRCGGQVGMHAWSADVAAIDQKIAQTFAAAGYGEPLRDVVVIGYSQGATRAEALAKRWPERYSRLVLIGAPTKPSPYSLSAIQGAVMLAGELDRKDIMKAGARALSGRGIPSIFFELPDARHGEMGSASERMMGQTFEWLNTHSRKPEAEQAKR